MERLCMRPGCDRSVVARLTYDTISCQVWLDPVRDRPGPAQEICELHTARLTVPRGWMLCDRRDESPALFVPEPPVESPEPVSATSARSTRPTRRHTVEAEEPQPELFDAAGAAEEPPEPEPAAPVEPAAQIAPAAPSAPSVQIAPAAPSAPAARVERRVAQTAPVARAAPASAPVLPEQGEPAAAVAATAAPERSPAGPDDRKRNGTRNGTRNGDAGRSAEPADPDPADPDVADRDVAEHDDEDLPESLQATSPLLSRAFRATGHQRSVLTQTLLNDQD